MERFNSVSDIMESKLYVLDIYKWTEDSTKEKHSMGSVTMIAYCFDHIQGSPNYVTSKKSREAVRNHIMPRTEKSFLTMR